MAATIELKSKATGIFDYTSMDLTPYIPAFTPDEAKLEKDIERVLKAHGTKESPVTVEDGDMVELSCDSETPKFNKKKIIVMVGKGLFSKEFEEKLVGKKLGVPFTVTADGAEVHGLVEKITRLVLPALTDENVAGFGMEGIATVDDLKAYCVDKQIDRLMDEMEEAEQASAALWQALSENCTFTLDDAEVARAQAAAEKKAAELEDQKVVFESEEEEQAFPKEYEEEYGESYQDLDMGKLVQDMYMTELRIAALGCETARREGTLLTEDDYDAFVRRYMEALPDRTEEEIRQLYPVEVFAKEQYNDIICERLDKFVADTFKKAMNPYK